MLTYHYVQNQENLMMQSRENGQKPQFGQFLDNFEAEYLEITNFSEKHVSFILKIIFSTYFRPKIRKILRAVSEKTALPTSYYQQHRSYRTSLTLV